MGLRGGRQRDELSKLKILYPKLRRQTRNKGFDDQNFPRRELPPKDVNSLTAADLGYLQNCVAEEKEFLRLNDIYTDFEAHISRLERANPHYAREMGFMRFDVNRRLGNYSESLENQ